MRMAHIVSEMCTFSTNTTFCHNCTSLHLLSLHLVVGSQHKHFIRKNYRMQEENEKIIKKINLMFPFLKKTVIILYMLTGMPHSAGPVAEINGGLKYERTNGHKAW